MTMPIASVFRELTVNAAGCWLLIAAATVLGAVLGSFLNVVAFRLTRGMSLSRPGSQCPSCHHPIRWYDNVPVVGWMWLGGRCRDCQSAISPRYPAVEGLMAAVGALVGSWSAALVGASVPDPVRRRFEETIEAGQILLVIDAEDEELARAEAAVVRAGATPLPYESATAVS